MYRFLQNNAPRARLAGACALGWLAATAPAAARRELSTDRPDQTESPYTVDAGLVQIEADIAHLTLDHDTAGGADVRTRIWSLAALNLKYGLNDRMDLQLMLDTHIDSRVEDRRAGVVERARGFGDVTTRLKINLWGNDGGGSALALMPFVKWPLSASALRNGKTEAGLIVPYARDLPAGWGLGAMTELDWVASGAGGRDLEWVNTITVGRDLGERLGVYLELVAVASDAPGYRPQWQFDLGFTVAFGPDAQLDFGCNFGITDSAPDYQPFLGYSRRF